eukprot:s427_g10.t1
MSLRDLPSLLRRRASSTVRDGWKVIRPGRSRQSVSSTDLGPQVNRLRQTAMSKSAGKLKHDEAESFLPGTIGSSPTARLQRSSAPALKVPEMPAGEEMSSVPTPSTGSSGVWQGALAPETPPSMLRTFAGLEHVTYFSDVQRPGSRPRPRPCFLHLEEAAK